MTNWRRKAVGKLISCLLGGSGGKIEAYREIEEANYPQKKDGPICTFSWLVVWYEKIESAVKVDESRVLCKNMPYFWPIKVLWLCWCSGTWCGSRFWLFPLSTSQRGAKPWVEYCLKTVDSRNSHTENLIIYLTLLLFCFSVHLRFWFCGYHVCGHCF